MSYLMMPRCDLFSDRALAVNRLIAALPGKDRARLLENCDEVELLLGKMLVEPGERIRHVYFPTDHCYISLLLPVNGRLPIEIGLIGNEGICGGPLILGIEVAALYALVQGSGIALRMSTVSFRRLLRDSFTLQQRLMRYMHVLMIQYAQSAGCARFHLIEQRLARWLLMTNDRAGSDYFQVTHAFLASMLGVRRPGVTEALSALKARSLIVYEHRHVTVVNRRGLEAAACSCYEAGVNTYQRAMH
jgi:hypothetical protein